MTHETHLSSPTDPSPGWWRLPAIFWLVVLCVLAVGAAVVLSLWVPRQQRERTIAEIDRRGGDVQTYRIRTGWYEALREGFPGTSNRRVVVVDLSSVPGGRDLIPRLTLFRELRHLSLSGPELTDDDLRPLHQLEKLQLLILVNCPNVSEDAERKLQQAIPGLRLFRRGPALLGVAGRSGREGCRIVGVRRGTAAERGGIHVGDVVTAVNGRRIHTFEALALEIGRYQPGEEITVTVLRRGEDTDVSVRLGRWTAR